MSERVAVVGLGYVGLPVALAFARWYPGTLGFDIDESRISELRAGRDRTGEASAEELDRSPLTFSADPHDLRDRTFFIVAVPTPVDADRRPDLRALTAASRTVGRSLTAGAVVVYESTVYPGATEEVCVPVLQDESGLLAGIDFTVGYSPERINPGDHEHTFERITKVVAAQDGATLERLVDAYGKVVPAGIHAAPSIKVAEAAKVIENTQRDLNVALMNELAIICDRIGIRTADVLAAARTKWNFLPFTPGLVGGHCIGVDPYYLTTRAEQLGYQPEVILAGRRINDRMGEFIAMALIRQLIVADIRIKEARIGILGLTFKEDVPDLRNSRVPDIVRTLADFGISPLVHDALADAGEAAREYSITLREIDDLTDLDGLIVAVPHRAYSAQGPAWLTERVRPGGVVVDVRSILDPADVPADRHLWAL